jgi:hypothetical protein
MSDAAVPTKKVLFRVVGNAAGDVTVETLWAFDLGGDCYRLDNSPFYAYSVSAGDVVLAPIDPSDGRPAFASVLEKCGNRTLRVIFDPPIQEGNASDAHLRKLVAMGCEYEGANRSYMAINLGPTVNFGAVCEYLSDHKLQWEHADPAYSELYHDET